MSAKPDFTDNSLLSAQDVCLKAGGSWILEHISLTVKPRDFITIIGPNGAGKTSLLKLLVGATSPTHGLIHRSPELRIGYVPQRLHSDNALPMPVQSFLRLNARGVSADEWQFVMEETQAHSLLAKDLSELSGGEMQRVLLAKALLKEPNLLILDEPAQNLDIHGQIAFYALLDKIYTHRQCAVVMVSHDLHVVLARSNHVMCLYGHICCEGKPEAIIHHPEFQLRMGKKAEELLAIFPHASHAPHVHEHDHTHHHDHDGGCCG